MVGFDKENCVRWCLRVQVLMRLAQVATAKATAAAATAGAGTANGGKTDESAAQAAAQAHLALCEARCLVRAMLRMPSSPEQGILPALFLYCNCFAPWMLARSCPREPAERAVPLISSWVL